MLIYPYMTADGTIAVKQGVDLNLVLTCDDGKDSPTLVDFSGASAAFKVVDSAGATILASVPTLGGAAGTITFAVADTVITALPPGTHSWDLTITWSDGDVERWETKPFLVVADL